MDNQFYQQGNQAPYGQAGDVGATGFRSPYGGVQQPIQPTAQPMPPVQPEQPVYQMPPVQQPYQNTAYQQQMQQPYQGTAYQQPYMDPAYQQAYQGTAYQQPMQPQQGMQPVQPKAPKAKLQLTPFHFAIIAAVLGFLGWYLYSNFAPQAARYGQITSGALSATRTGECLIVRNEVPYDAEGVTSVVYEAEEGASVNRGDKICKVYSSGYSTREMNTLKTYREQIRNYQKNLIETENPPDARLDRVMNEVKNYAKQVRELVNGGRGSLAAQEEMLRTAVSERQIYLKNKYTSDQRFSRLYDDELSQKQRIDSWTTSETATGSAVVSFYSDGYEYALNGTNYTTFEPKQVRSMINGNAPEKTNAQMGKTTIYRMVEDGEWYVLFLSHETDWNPVNGQTYALQLGRYESTQVYAEVVNFTRSGGELLLRLKVNSDVRPVLYMRSGEAILGENLSTLCVSERALYTQDKMTGIVVVDNNTESFIPINVIYQADGNVYFQPVQQGVLYEGLTVMLF